MSMQHRLEELRLLEPDWLDGEGSPLDPAGLDWLESVLRDQCAVKMPVPYICPSPDGQVLFEWSITPKSASLEIDLAKRKGYWHVLDLETKTDFDEDLDLSSADGWHKVADRLAALREDHVSDREGTAGCSAYWPS